MNENKFWLALNIYHEARNQSDEGQIAVGHVVLNRAIRRGKTVKEVILEPYQFSWLNGANRPPIDDYEALYHSLEIACEVIRERLEGKDLNGADHYYADYISKPAWAMDMREVAHVGAHIFFRS